MYYNKKNVFFRFNWLGTLFLLPLGFFLLSCSSNNADPNSTSYSGGFYVPEENQRTKNFSASKDLQVKPKPLTVTSPPVTKPLRGQSGLSALSANEPSLDTIVGKASWYGPGFHGKKTANGEVFDQNAYTVAHKTLPFGTKLRITNLSNNKVVHATVNDRGPFIPGRILDGSKKIAEELEYIGTGTADVKIEVLSYGGKGALSNSASAASTNRRLPFANKPIAQKQPVKAPPTVVSVQKKPVQPNNNSFVGMPGSGNQYIQIGAFSSNERALHYMKQVGEKYNVNGLFVKKNDRGLFRVLIGPVSDDKVAGMVSRLNAGGVKTWVHRL